MDSKQKFNTVDEYIDSFSGEVKSKLQEIRKAIKKAAPKAEEKIAYNMPAYKQEGYVLYFSGYKSHIGIYPRLEAFKKELANFEGGKGTVKLPLDKPLPLKLISDMVKFQVAKNLAKLKK